MTTPSGPAFVAPGCDAIGGHLASDLLPSYLTREGAAAQIRRDIGIGLDAGCEHLLTWPAFRRSPESRDAVLTGSVNDVLQRWRLDHGQDLTLTGSPCLWSLWATLAALVVLRQFHTLAGCLEPKKGPVPAQLLVDLDPRHDRVEAEMIRLPEISTDDLMTPQRFNLLSDALRKWAPCLLGSRSSSAVGGGLDAHWFSEPFLANMAEWADRLAASCDLDAAGRNISSHKRLFKSEFLVNTMLVASMLRSESLLGEVVERTVATIAPAAIRLWLEQTGLKVADMVPHFSTLSRAKLPFVAAYRLTS